MALSNSAQLLGGGALAVLAVGGWAFAIRERRRLQEALVDVEVRIERLAMFDEVTGLLSREGQHLVGQQIVDIARRDSDAVCACLIRVLAPPNRGLAVANDDDVLSVAEASEVVFRSGDAVGRLDEDTLMVAGKGPGFTPSTVEARLVAQMATMAAPDADLPALVVGVSVLHPWDEGTFDELLHLAYEDLAVRLHIFAGS